MGSIQLESSSQKQQPSTLTRALGSARAISSATGPSIDPITMPNSLPNSIDEMIPNDFLKETRKGCDIITSSISPGKTNHILDLGVLDTMLDEAIGGEVGGCGSCGGIGLDVDPDSDSSSGQKHVTL